MKVTITEVGLRDSLQNEPEFYPADKKIQVANSLIGAGVRRMEAIVCVPKDSPSTG